MNYPVVKEEESIAKQHLAPIVKEVTKLRNICSLIESDFMSTKNDMGNLQVCYHIIRVKNILNSSCILCMQMRLRKFIDPILYHGRVSLAV